jgi:NADH-quinone oxidoreductase subunit C
MTTFAERVAAALPDAVVTESFGDRYAEVPSRRWHESARVCRDELGLRYFDWLSAVDELEGRLRVVLHVVAPATLDRLLLTSTVTEGEGGARLPSITSVYAGASWHERETWEMFGIGFDDHPNLVPLLLPDGFVGQPLRKDFVLASRVAKPWPGAKEPGESGSGSPSRRKTLPPGVPDPSHWGPGAGGLEPGDEEPADA